MGAILACAMGANAASKDFTPAKPYFEQNLGQTSGPVKFLQRGPDYTLFLTSNGAVLKLQRKEPSNITQEAVVRMSWENANAANVAGEDIQPGQVNYLNRTDASSNITGVPTYGRVLYRSLYPKIDLIHYSAGGELEHDLRIAAGGDPSAIVLHFEGPDALTVAADGALTAKVGRFQIHQSAPVAYQMIGDRRQPVAVRYALLGDSRVGFQVGPYDRRYELVIDPVLRYSTLVGGTSAVDFNGNPAAATTIVSSMAVDKKGNVYIAGTTTATDYPTTTGAFSRNAGADCERGASFCASSSGFVTKLNPSGSGLVYSTYINTASNGVGIDALAIDAAGNAYITSTDGCSDCEQTPVVLDKLNASGSALAYTFFFTGSCGLGFELANAIAINAAGEAYFAGHTTDTCLPTTSGAFQRTATNLNGEVGYIVRVNAAGTEALDATYFGSSTAPANGQEERIADLKLDSTGNVYV
ncbi:MAG TPA: SBBP repeat-containing protein, partial [Candidatus Angelobacter sp.]|nr:SBBP repeat-containing protein [Candidatus Angelobacter sp.]